MPDVRWLAALFLRFSVFAVYAAVVFGQLSAARTEARKLLDAGKPYLARAKLKAAIELQRKQQTQEVADLLSDLADVYSRLDKEAEALAALEEAAETVAVLHGHGDSRYGLALDKLAGAHMQAGEHGKAYELYQELLDAMRRNLGTAHPGYQFMLSKLAQAAAAADKQHAAAEAFGELLEMANPSRAAEDVASVRVQYSIALAKMGKLEKALKQAILAEQEYAASEGAGSLQHAASINGVAGVLEKIGRDDEAVAAMSRAHELVQALDHAQPDKEERLRQAKRNLDGLKEHIRRKREVDKRRAAERRKQEL
uniref:MalT-like TPR region domain-containing protein n=1 Tax=Calcidiscus leptoporus TaxID=127549 RepID=A0A7S0NMZ4_9EUKA|mmetsp:Transcript_11700/g.27025  ORF Transcript_11700/g.27025 Transcript_11700/m.27025 type:complete len:311 (+) Transcript_11700:112-1044(+)